jgi:tetratricopeptide (TPR) repeat protein
VLILIAAGYIYVTEHEIRYWESDYELAQHGIMVSPGHAIALQLLGNDYIRQGRAAEAVPWLVESLEADPNSVQTLCSLAFCYWDMDALPLAEEAISKALLLKKPEPRAHMLLGMVRLKQDRLDEAESEIRQGIQLQRQLGPGVEMLFHYYLGNVLFAKGNMRGAVDEYRLELRNDSTVDPAVADSRIRLRQIEGSARF